MCYNCGCHIPQDDMGHPDNITDQTLEELAKARKVTVAQLKTTLKEYLTGGQSGQADFEAMFDKASKAWGQSIEDAKKQTLKML